MPSEERVVSTFEHAGMPRVPDGWRKREARVYEHEATGWVVLRTNLHWQARWEIGRILPIPHSSFPRDYDLGVGYGWPEYRRMTDAMKAVEEWFAEHPEEAQ